MIRSTQIRGKKYLVVIDIIRECNPSPKPSKVWSEYKVKHGKPAVNSKQFGFSVVTSKLESENGRVYDLECVQEKDKGKVEAIFGRDRRKKEEVVKPLVLKVGKVLSTQDVEAVFTALKKCHDEIVKILK